jgi:hypothetical protein
MRNHRSARHAHQQAPQSSAYERTADIAAYVARHGVTVCRPGKPYELERPRSRVRYVRAVAKRLGRTRTSK